MTESRQTAIDPKPAIRDSRSEPPFLAQSGRSAPSLDRPHLTFIEAEAACVPDIVEVIGHTDEQPMAGRSMNLDAALVKTFRTGAAITNLSPGDNAGPGMARAVSVASVLRFDPRLKGVTILPLSAAQMIMPGDRVADGSDAGDVKQRRRIEIRVRRRSDPSPPP